MGFLKKNAKTGLPVNLNQKLFFILGFVFPDIEAAVNFVIDSAQAEDGNVGADKTIEGVFADIPHHFKAPPEDRDFEFLRFLHAAGEAGGIMGRP